ncbi:MAG: alpha/beta fold hydrolase [Rhodospirillaceae bacterium]|nr:alpha/beta fold hydrolase [Rhodospirillaceae bacterium]
MVQITRHFATIAVPGERPRQVHYRKSGSGPAVVLLHQSPVSSAEYEHLLNQWGDVGLTFIAPDTPSFGLSDSLPGEEPLIEPYAKALAQFLDAIGVERCGIYGTHTGAMIAAEFARAYPERTDVCCLNGYVVATKDEVADVMANYFVPLVPRDDGSHMVWAWVRMRDQMIFYPWYRKTAASRMTFDVPSADFLQPFMMDFFRCANDGLRAYKAAFTYDAIKGLKGMTSPCYVMAFQQDVLHEHLGRIPNDMPTCVTLEGHPTPMAVEARALELFKQHCKGATPPHAATATIESRPWQAMATTKQGQIYLRRSHMGTGKPVVMIHDAGRSSKQFHLLQQMLHGQRPTLAFDLPGHGDTGASAGPQATVETLAQAISEALADLGVGEADILATGAGCAVAAHLNIQNALKVYVDPWPIPTADKAALKSQLAPALVPSWYGAHLVEAWAVARDAELYWPWFAPTHANAIQSKPSLEAGAVHVKALDLLKARGAHGPLVASALDTDVAKTLQGVTVGALNNGPHFAGAQSLSKNVVALSDDPSRYAAALAAMFRG